MSCLTFHLTDTDHPDACYAIVQNETYNQLTIYYPNVDLTAGTLSGRISDNYKDEDQTFTVDFNFEPMVFGTFTFNGKPGNYTQIKPFLTCAQTLALPVPPRTRTTATDRVVIGGTGANVWVYDIYHTDASNVCIKLIRGYVEVIPSVTQ